jgi:hypothetical protein
LTVRSAIVWPSRCRYWSRPLARLPARCATWTRPTRRHATPRLALTGCDYHPNLSDHRLMGATLVKIIEQHGGAELR